MRYKIGKVQDPREDDPEFATWEEALSAAYTMSYEDSWVIAIWTRSGAIEALVYCGQAFM